MPAHTHHIAITLGLIGNSIKKSTSEHHSANPSNKLHQGTVHVCATITTSTRFRNTSSNLAGFYLTCVQRLGSCSTCRSLHVQAWGGEAGTVAVTVRSWPPAAAGPPGVRWCTGPPPRPAQWPPLQCHAPGPPGTGSGCLCQWACHSPAGSHPLNPLTRPGGLGNPQ